MKITNDIKYVGVNDHEIDLFEGQYVVENGMAYKAKAYTLREESTESGTRYFISFKDGQGKSHELEVSEQFFMEFRQMERRNRNLF